LPQAAGQKERGPKRWGQVRERWRKKVHESRKKSNHSSVGEPASQGRDWDAEEG